MTVQPVPLTRSQPVEPRLLVIGGVMRGGTTMLQSLLASHRNVALFAREMRALSWCGQPGLIHALRVHHHLLIGKRRFRHPEFRRQVYRYLGSFIRENGLFQKSVGVELCHRAIASSIARADSLYVGDKYPEYVFHTGDFINRPDCRVILIVRDPRDVAGSLFHRIRNGDWAGKSWAKQYSSLDGACQYWNEAARVMAGQNHPDSPALVIRYEDLVMQTQSTVDRISAFLQIDPDGFDLSPIHSKSIGKHAFSLNAAEIRRIEQETSILMTAFGYGE